MNKKNLTIGILALIILSGLIIFQSLLPQEETHAPEMKKRQWDASGIGDIYNYEFKCPDPSASIWKMSISVELKEKGACILPDFVSVAILYYTGEPSASDEGWRVYPNAFNYTEGDYAETTLEVELDPSKTYRLGVETDPKLSWGLQATEEWG